jgi:hypothetical protein
MGYAGYGSQVFYLLKEPDEQTLPGLRYLKQRTEEWLNAREDGALSSSEIGTALNFYGLDKAKEIQAKLWRKVSSMQIEIMILVWGNRGI